MALATLRQVRPQEGHVWGVLIALRETGQHETSRGNVEATLKHRRSSFAGQAMGKRDWIHRMVRLPLACHYCDALTTYLARRP